jgi:hypothetical protein
MQEPSSGAKRRIYVEDLSGAVECSGAHRLLGRVGDRGEIVVLMVSQLCGVRFCTEWLGVKEMTLRSLAPSMTLN